MDVAEVWTKLFFAIKNHVYIMYLLKILAFVVTITAINNYHGTNQKRENRFSTNQKRENRFSTNQKAAVIFLAQ
jgi:hypothetical protein